MPSLWELLVEGLQPGENTVEVLAFDASGELLGADTIQVWNTAAWADPVLTTVEPATAPEGGGTTVTLRGSGFESGTTATLGDLPIGDLAIVSPTEIHGLGPRGPQDGGEADVAVRLLDGREARLITAFTYLSAVFRRGDADGDENLTVTDAIVVLEAIFRRGDLTCADAADANDDGKLTLIDPLFILDVLFRGRSSLPAPFESPDVDSTPDSLLCDRSVL
jgi:hypothetical protein